MELSSKILLQILLRRTGLPAGAAGSPARSSRS